MFKRKVKSDNDNKKLSSDIDWEVFKINFAAQLFLDSIKKSEARQDILMDNAIRTANSFVKRYKNFKD